MKDGKADLKLNFQLGQPWEPHLQQPSHGKGNARELKLINRRKETKKGRPAAHQSRKAAASADPSRTAEYERHDLGHGVFFHQIFEFIYLF